MNRLIILTLVLLSACAVRRTENGTVGVEPISDRIGNWDASIGPVNNSGIRGAVAARSTALASSASVSISGAKSGAQHPWHIHRGTCGNDLGIVGGSDKYPVLTVNSDGTASATASLSVALDENNSYFVNIHRSATDLSTIVACGPLKH